VYAPQVRPARPALTFLLPAIAACAPPPLPGSATSIAVIFPPTATDTVICPTFTMVVDVDGFTLIDREPAAGEAIPDDEGHWHLYVGDAYLGTKFDAWTTVGLEPALYEQGTVIARAVLARLDHNELDVVATTEFTVADTPGCVGDAPPATE
jgi:hypothetical protein